MSTKPSSEPTSPLERVRPTFTRSHTIPAKFHPTQSARAQLGDTAGAVYLPTYDTPCTLTTATKTSISLFSGSKQSFPASACAPSTAPKSEHDSSIFSAYVCPGMNRRNNTYPPATGSNGHAATDSTVSLTLSGAASSSDIDSSVASSAHSRTQKCHDPEPQSANVVESKRIHTSKTNHSQHSINTLDGTYDEDSSPAECSNFRKILSTDQSEHRIPRPGNVSFVIDDALRKRSMAVQRGEDSSSFLDPFTGIPVFDETDMSDVSHASEYLRPNAFAGHRDTLARIHPAYLTRSSGTNQWYTPSSRKLTIDFSAEAGKRFPGHRDSLARLHSNHNKAKVIPLQVLDRIFHFLSFQDYKNLRLTCRQWYQALPCVTLPSSCRLPSEVLHQIYQYLQPCEFDAARHTCRSWFLASLDRETGRNMMEKAGCHSAFLADIEQRRRILQFRHLRRLKQTDIGNNCDYVIDQEDSDGETFNEEWLISKRLATESRLSAAWHGSGLVEDGNQSSSRLATTTIIDFQRFIAIRDDDRLQVKRFTVSSCGDFVMVVLGANILVYSLDLGSSTMRPCVRLVADKDILKVSMDTSCGRYAVAALLEGRTGMCWDIRDLFAPGQISWEADESISLGMQTEVYGLASSQSTLSGTSSSHDQRGQNVSMSGEERQNDGGRHADTSGGLEFRQMAEGHAASTPPIMPLHTSCLAPSTVSPTEWLAPSLTAPVRFKPSNVYRNLGYSDDDPRSVAICPYRNSVAFGCKTGIELHWVDSLTGRDVSRWFPLAAPSDYLYFLPPRQGIDSCKKLRLMSSATEPSAGAVSEYKMSQYDYFHAIPLSDGTHVVYTDPTIGLLCLGSHVLSDGPTKLIRKLCLIPPTSNDTTNRLPKSYAVGQDLSWGVRIIVAYEDGNIVLFNIPRDYFDRIRDLQASSDDQDEMAGVAGQDDSNADSAPIDPANSAGILPSTADPLIWGISTYSRSLQVEGTSLYKVNPDVEDLQIDCHGGGLRLCIFHRSGHVRKMDIYAARNQRVLSYIAEVDGSLTNATDVPDIQLPQDHPGQTEAMNITSRYDSPGNHIRFVGLDGVCDYDHLLQRIGA